MRHDLLALTDDDLAALTNRGIVKRAVKELDAGQWECDFEEPESGVLVVTWSDGTRCEFPAGGTLEDAVCSSGAFGISRHVVRSVIAYRRAQEPAAGAGRRSEDSAPPQPLEETPPVAENTADPKQEAAGAVAEAGQEADQEADQKADQEADQKADQEADQKAGAEDETVDDSWDPGQIADDVLVEHFGKAFISRARKRFERGLLVELVRGPKPLARFLDDPCTLRFMVPGDPRYVSADCTERERNTFTALAVWAFRELAPEKQAGMVSIQLTSLPVPESLLDDLEKALEEVADRGLANLGKPWRDRLRRLENRLLKEQLVWPAGIVQALCHAHDQYENHDARFDAQEVLHEVGELLIRSDAIRSDTGAVPQLLVRGSQADRESTVGSARLCGLGCEVVPHPHAATLNVYLQDLNTGSLVVVERHFADPADGQPRTFTQLGSQTLTRGVTLRQLAAGQLLLKSAKRTASHRLILPRSGLTINPQEFRWEDLRPPALAESFSEVKALQSELPPLPLRPRRLTEDVHVVAIEAIDSSDFDEIRQELIADLTDRDGLTARLVLPYHARGEESLEVFASLLRDPDLRLKFVAGHCSVGRGILKIRPLSCVFARGEKRFMVQPWIEPAKQASSTARLADKEAQSSQLADPIDAAHHQLGLQLADTLLVGIRRSGEMERAAWEELLQLHERTGFVQLTEPLRELVACLNQRRERRQWDSLPATRKLLELAVLHRLAGELG